MFCWRLTKGKFMFNYETISELPEMKADTSDKGRFYTTPQQNVYPSVTTILSAGTDQSWLKEWEKRVGSAEVAKVSAQAARRGTAVHEICEKYLQNDPSYAKGQMPNNMASFRYLKPYLDKHITSIAGLELPLYSDKLRVAGRVDCLGKWDYEWAIIDFKTSKRAKTKEQIHSYFMQTSCYAFMVYERLGIFPKNIVIAMTVDDSEAQIFVERSAEWLPKFIEIRKTVDL
jgi:hypothetical protein